MDLTGFEVNGLTTPTVLETGGTLAFTIDLITDPSGYPALDRDPQASDMDAATYQRYTGNYRGSIQGWANENIFAPNPFKKKLPGVDRFYMVGQWVQPGGGLPPAATSAREVIGTICAQDGKTFTTQVP